MAAPPYFSENPNPGKSRDQISAVHGLIRRTPVGAKSATFLVAIVIPCESAVAAIKASRSERGFGT